MSVSPFLLLHGGCSCDDSSQLVYSTSTLCTYVQLMTFRMMISRHNDIVVPNQCYGIIVLWSPRRYHRLWSYDLGPNELGTIIRRL